MRQDNHKVPEPLLEALSRYVIPAIYKEAVHDGAQAHDISANQSLSLAKASLSHDTQACASMVLAWHQLGIPVTQIFAKGVRDAAAHLGDWWLQDQISFAEVTLAAERLQHLVLNSQGLFGKSLHEHQHSNGYVVVFAKAVPCQHTLGVLVVGEIFRQQGWHVISPTGSDTSWMDTLAQSHVHLLGVSVAHSDQLSSAQTLIAACRRLSKNANLSVMVGGPYAMTCVDLATKVGADFVAQDASEGELQARHRVDALRRSTSSNQALYERPSMHKSD